MLRLFIAIDLPPSIKEQVARLQDVLKKQSFPLRLEASSKLHLTLKFLGAVEDETVPEIISAIKDCCVRSKQFRVKPAKLGVFPDISRPRVLWLGMEEDENILSTLSLNLDKSFTPLGFAPESAFHAHVTLGRFNNHLSRGQKEQLAVLLSHKPPIFIDNFSAEKVSLYQSVLGQGGSQYTILKEFLLPLG